MASFIKKKGELGGDRAQFDIDVDCRRYLSATDWYVIREQETGEPIPIDIKENRALARSEVESSFETVI